jgi:hypothetical protein
VGLKVIAIKNDEKSLKPYRVRWEGHPRHVLGSFDSLQEAIAFAARQRLDRRYYVTKGRQIVWPKGFKPRSASRPIQSD